MLYDVFICHASEDKEGFVRPLADALRMAHIEPWYDEFSLKLGDSIRRAIDRGLGQSRYGIVVLSPAFFAKRWTQYELDGLVEKEISDGNVVILPVWHNVSHEGVMQHSPSLAGRKGVATANGLDGVVAEILAVVKPKGSPLLDARDKLLEWGVPVPVVTDEYWLHVVAASNRTPGTGALVPVETTWGRWSFPLPSSEGGTSAWGSRLCWTAMQLNWSKTADEVPITPLSPPATVHDFIEKHPGLLETCMDYADLAAEYAPQLTIPGLGGPLEETFAKAFAEHRANRKTERVDQEWSVREACLGNHESASHVAHDYFGGTMFGPWVSPYDEADHLFWLLSDASRWLPKKLRALLQEGMLTSHAWPWQQRTRNAPTRDWPSCGALSEELFRCDGRKRFRWTSEVVADVSGYAAAARDLLGLPESAPDLAKRFKHAAAPERHLEAARELHRRQRSRK